jgi:hypothetical protein
MVALGLANSRMKDFFDLRLLARQFNFDGAILVSAIRATFSNRETSIVNDPVVLTDIFAKDPDKQKQWRAFVRKNRLEDVSEDLAEVVAEIASFLRPVIVAITSDKPFLQHWPPLGSWRAV